VLAWVLRGNLVASAIGTAVGNPFTFPFIWASTLAAGRFILHGSQPEEIVPLQLGHALSQLEFVHVWEPLLKPMTIGALPVGGAVALPGILHIGLIILTAALVGALWSTIAGVLKATRGVHEVISTIMLNWVAVSLVENWLVVGPLRAIPAALAGLALLYLLVPIVIDWWKSLPPEQEELFVGFGYRF
jgi:hypothetical protein